MKNSPRQDHLPIWTILFLLFFYSIRLSANTKQVTIHEVWLTNAFPIRYENPDSAVQLAQKAFHKAMNEGDTTKAIQMLSVEANINGHQAYYRASYDKLWKALMLADEARLEELKASLYISIGRYYSYFKRKEKSIRIF